MPARAAFALGIPELGGEIARYLSPAECAALGATGSTMHDIYALHAWQRTTLHMLIQPLWASMANGASAWKDRDGKRQDAVELVYRTYDLRRHVTRVAKYIKTLYLATFEPEQSMMLSFRSRWDAESNFDMAYSEVLEVLAAHSRLLTRLVGVHIQGTVLSPLRGLVNILSLPSLDHVHLNLKRTEIRDVRALLLGDWSIHARVLTLVLPSYKRSLVSDMLTSLVRQAVQLDDFACFGDVPGLQQPDEGNFPASLRAVYVGFAPPASLWRSLEQASFAGGDTFWEDRMLALEPSQTMREWELRWHWASEEGHDVAGAVLALNRQLCRIPELAPNLRSLQLHLGFQTLRSNPPPLHTILEPLSQLDLSSLSVEFCYIDSQSLNWIVKRMPGLHRLHLWTGLFLGYDRGASDKICQLRGQDVASALAGAHALEDLALEFDWPEAVANECEIHHHLHRLHVPAIQTRSGEDLLNLLPKDRSAAANAAHVLGGPILAQLHIHHRHQGRTIEQWYEVHESFHDGLVVCRTSDTVPALFHMKAAGHPWCRERPAAALWTQLEDEYRSYPEQRGSRWHDEEEAQEDEEE